MHVLQRLYIGDFIFTTLSDMHWDISRMHVGQYKLVIPTNGAGKHHHMAEHINENRKKPYVKSVADNEISLRFFRSALQYLPNILVSNMISDFYSPALAPFTVDTLSCSYFKHTLLSPFSSCLLNF